MNRNDYTAAVIGGGPAGAAAARVLAHAGAAVLLLGARSPQAFQVGESLVPAARTILEELGLWSRFSGGGHLPCYGNSSAWGGPQPIDTDFIRSPYGHGWHLDRVHFDDMLCQMAAESGAACWPSARLLRLERQRSTWRLAVQTPAGMREVACQWLIDCSGRSGRVAASLGIERRYADRLLAFYARFRPAAGAEADEDSRTLVESVPQGWLHTALLPAGERVVTFFTDAATPWLKRARSSEGFLDLIAGTAHISARLKAHCYSIAERPRATDARSGRLERFHGQGWLAAGDAATSFDPLSSQGILSALYSGLKAGQALVRHLDGDPAALPHYGSLITDVYESFLRNRLHYYGYERRWLESPFWQARSGLDQ
ncbi:MAG: NAD(P)/FAD-dependent oxidoreductase [Roseiflexaceae bacterium]